MQVYKIANERANILLSDSEELSSLIQEISEYFHSKRSRGLSRGDLNSRQMKKWLTESLSTFNFTKNRRVVRDFPDANLSPAHVTVDFQGEIRDENGSLRRFSLEFCADNRAVMGSNILKLDLAGRNFTHGALNSLAIAVTLTEELRELGWDDSVGVYDEYVYAVLNTYATYLDSPFIVLGISPE